MSSRIVFLFQSTTLHGLGRLVDERRKGWKKGFARIFWTCFIAISFYLMVEMLKATIIKGSKSTSINLDTSFRDWTNGFPAISLCLNKGRSTNIIKDTVGKVHTNPDGSTVSLKMKHYRAMQSLLFVNYQQPTEGISLETCAELNETCGIDFDLQRKRLLPRDCRQIMDKVFYMGRQLECHEIFIPVETEYGTCFVANSLYSKGRQNWENFDSLPLKFTNHDNRERSLEFHYIESDFLLYKLFVHTPEELPNGKLENIGLSKIGILTKVDIKTTEFLNNVDVKYEDMEARECRFPFERLTNKNLSLNLPYSVNYCRYLKRVENEMKSCGCTFPLGLATNDTMKVCQVTDFECLNTLALETDHKLKNYEQMMGYMSECLMQSCVSMDINKVGEYEVYFNSSTTGAVKIEIVNKPTLRYIRRVTFTKLDMIVQIGGIIGLFFGASVLSILELFYLFYRIFIMKAAKME